MKRGIAIYFRFNTNEKLLKFLASSPRICALFKAQEFVLNNPNPLAILEPIHRKNYEILLYKYCADQRFYKRFNKRF